MTKRVYRSSWIARLFYVLITGGWFLVFGSPTKEDSLWMVLGWWMLSLIFSWLTVMSFLDRIVIDEDALTYRNPLFQLRHVPWSDIKGIRSDFTPPVGGESITLRVYNIINRNNRILVIIGPWIARYKDLLRDILVHAPDDAKTDVNVYHAIRRRGETIQDAYRALGHRRQERLKERASS